MRCCKIVLCKRVYIHKTQKGPAFPKNKTFSFYTFSIALKFGEEKLN